MGILSLGWSRTIPTWFRLPIFGKTCRRQLSWGLGRTAQKGRQKMKKKSSTTILAKKIPAFISSIPLKTTKKDNEKKVTKHLIIKKCRAVTLIHTVLQKKSVNLSFKKVRLKLKKKSCEIVVGIRNKRRHNQLRK